MMIKKIVLASGSPRRRELLGAIGLDFEVVLSQAPEIMLDGERPQVMVQRLAKDKAEDVCKKVGDSLIIAADTVVSKDGAVLGKPKDEQDAARMLTALSGRWHEVFTGICVMHKDRCVTAFERTSVKFRDLTGQEIEAYINTKEPMDKAGAYGIQALGATIVERIDGDYFNVVGLPLCLLGKILKEDFAIDIIK